MNIETKTSGIKISETAAGCGSEVLAETDIILSETHPDILRILQIDGTAMIREKEVSNDRVILRGDAELCVIYVPDPNMSDMPAKSIKATAAFTDVCEAAGVSADMKIHSCAEISNIEYSLINSRKISVKATVSTEIKAVRQGETNFISGAESDDGSLQTLLGEVRALRQEADDDFTITVSDKLEIPAGKPASAEILKVMADVMSTDVRLIAGKAIIKGNVNVGTLYVGKKNLNIEFMEHEIPFTEILELPGVSDEMDADLDYSVTSVYYETDDEEEEMRTLGVEVTIEVNANVTSHDSAEILADCYSPDCDITLTKKVCEIDYIAAVLKPQINVRGTISMGSENPSAEQIYNVSAKPVIDKILTNGGKTTLEGRLCVNVLYLTTEAEMPLCSIKGEIPFTHMIDSEDAADAAAECSVHLTSCSYTLSDNSTINIRASLAASIKFICPNKVNVIEDIKVTDADIPSRSPIVIYFVQSGDTLWNIAKRYRTTVDKIAAANSIDPNKTLNVGDKLLIP